MVIPLTDAIGALGELSELYPETPPSAWEQDRSLYPELFDGTRWRLICTCYLVQSGGTNVLVDTGVGPAGLWEWEPEWEEGLVPALAAHGIEPGDVDVVFLTHMHVDHVGWNTDAEGEIVFPRARYVLHRDALAAARERADRPHIRRCVLPLVDRGVVDELDGETELAPGVVAFPLPGHDPGHMGVRIGSDAVLIGDAAAHPALLAEPERVFALEWDHDASAATRRALLDELAKDEGSVICGHYPGTGIGRVRKRDGRIVWESGDAL